MRRFGLRLCRCDRRRWKVFLLIFVTIFNFAFGLFLILSVLSIAEKQKSSEESSIDQLNEIEEITPMKISPVKSVKSNYQYYFRIDYTIFQSTCRTISTFNTTTNLISIQNLTISKLKGLFPKNLTIDMDIISIDTILKKTDKIKQNGIHQYSKTVCDYLLQLYIGLDISSYCNNDCRIRGVRRLISKSEPFGDTLDESFLFLFYPTNPSESIITYHINQMFIYQSCKYRNKGVYIRSYYDNRYISSLIIDAAGDQSSITMSQIDRSLFLIKDGLDQYFYERDSYTILISFLSPTARNAYLRHESARIKLGKNNHSALFKQDATFKLLFSQSNKDLIAFQAINLPHFYIGIDTESQTAVVLAQIEQTESTNIDLLDKRFLFKFIFDE